MVTCHYCVPKPAGVPSRTPADAGPLEQATGSKVGHPGTRWGTACGAAWGGPGFSASGEAWAVNCPECQKTKAWQDAPDDGPHRKRPAANG